MISGHRRKIASELAYKKKIPCIIRDLSDNEAVVIMVDSNLQRENPSGSEVFSRNIRRISRRK